MTRIIIERKKLVKIIKNLLKEEIVTVHRDSGDFVYDVDFTELGSIRKGSLLPSVETMIGKKRNRYFDDIMKIAKIYTTEPVHKIYNKIRSLSPDSPIFNRERPRSVERIVEELNTNWTDALEWNPQNRKGRGDKDAADGVEGCGGEVALGRSGAREGGGEGGKTVACDGQIMRNKYE